MTEWELEKSVDDSTYVLKNITENTLTWFQTVKIDRLSVRLYDRNFLVAYFPKKSLPLDIINELENLPNEGI